VSTLVDTNILARSVEPQHLMHQSAVDAAAALRQQGEELCVVPQNLYEFWVICTRPASQNGLGLTVAEAQREMTGVRGLFALREDTPAILPEWERLVTTYQVSGKSAHDARLVAAMIVHGLGRLLTFNAGDFLRYPGIVVVTPQQVLAPPAPSVGP
jgi:predicted nucleic acid-binding protein